PEHTPLQCTGDQGHAPAPELRARGRARLCGHGNGRGGDLAGLRLRRPCGARGARGLAGATGKEPGMKPAILLFAAAAMVGAAPPPPSRSAGPTPRYEAGGFEPFWSLVIEGGRLTYNPGTGETVFRIRTPRRQRTRAGYRYVV